MCLNVPSKYIDPFTDFGFKHIFGNEENKVLLISFLNDLLEIEDKIVDITYRNLEKLGLSIIDRRAIFDVYCTDEKGNNFIVELQRSKQKYFKDRSIYYTSFPIQEQSEKGTWDYHLEKVFFVGILEFSMDDSSNNYLTKVQLCDMESKEVFYDKLTYYYIEMPKFKKKEEELSTHLEYWMWYLNNLVTLEEIPQKLKEDKLLKQAFDVAKFLALNKDEQLAYQLDLKAKLDYQNVMDYAREYAKEQGREEGREEGIKEGIKEGREEGIKEGEIKGEKKGLEQGEKNKAIEIAKKLLDILDIETISLKTDLTIEEIKKLKK